MKQSRSSVEVKAALLSEGMQITDQMIKNYGPPFLLKRRAYGNPDPLRLQNAGLPQEIYIGEAKERLVVSVNIKDDSPWKLDYDDGQHILIDPEHQAQPIDFPLKPEFYDQILSTRQRVSQLITLYGGGSLGIFAYGNCALVDMGKACHYCSIAPNRGRQNEFEYAISEEKLVEALRLTLNQLPPHVTQIMLNGGNFPDRDKSFKHYARLARRISEVIKEEKAGIEAHLIVYPPENLDVIEELAGADVSVSMNTEVFDPKLFNKYCPGKVATGGRDHIFEALRKAVDVVGKGHVFSIMVGGLEPMDSLDEGLHYLAEQGVNPVVNVLHTDPETPLENFPNPSTEVIMEMGRRLQAVYQEYSLRPFYMNCGRNSIDTEAFKKLF